MFDFMQIPGFATKTETDYGQHDSIEVGGELVQGTERGYADNVTVVPPPPPAPPHSNRAKAIAQRRRKLTRHPIYSKALGSIDEALAVVILAAALAKAEALTATTDKATAMVGLENYLRFLRKLVQPDMRHLLSHCIRRELPTPGRSDGGTIHKHAADFLAEITRMKPDQVAAFVERFPAETNHNGRPIDMGAVRELLTRRSKAQPT